MTEETVVKVRTPCFTCGSHTVRKLAVAGSVGPRHWGFVVSYCADCERTRGSYDVRNKPVWVEP